MRDEVCVCEVCGYRNIKWLVAHEIARGIHRRKARGKRFATLILCNGFGGNCHDKMDGMPLAKQLAYLFHSRSGDLDLEAFYRLTARRFPAEADVMLEVKRLVEPKDGE